jgi:lipopolysaccharide biosynthesis glycosyltransferase
MNAIVTLSIGDSYRLPDVTHPMMRAYADKIGADFVVINTPKLNLSSVHYEKYQIYELLDTYQRIIYLDTDILVNPDCLNLFKIVPEKNFGCFLISNHTYYHDGEIKIIQKELGDLGWKREYFNSGVMVFSQHHRQIFNIMQDPGMLAWAMKKRDFYLDQTLLNYAVQKSSTPIYDIGYKFNHTTSIKKTNRLGKNLNKIIEYIEKTIQIKIDKNSAKEFDKYLIDSPENSQIQHRFKSYMIHYTGKGHRARGSKLEQIQKDLFYLERKHLAQAVCFFPVLERFL